MIEELVVRVFNTRNVAHLAHLKTKSYAQHVVLGGFYESVIGVLDSIIEVHQGVFGLINVPYLPKIETPANIVKHIEAEMKWICDNRAELAQGVTAIENLIDSLSEIYMQTLYKLKNLS